MLSEEISLVIFTCEGREHLIRNTIKTFKEACNYSFYKIILAIDGTISESIIEYIRPDVVIQSTSRKGYINNIMQALRVLETNYFFWLEDDWHFPVHIPVDHFQRLLSSPEVLQVVLSKSELNSNFTKYENDYYIPLDGFSANPGICKTLPVKTGFESVRALKKDQSTRLVGFENALNEYAKTNGLITLKYITNNMATVVHSGELESTAREYHMINSLEAETTLIGKEYISGFGFDTKISVKNKAGMMLKLWKATFLLSKRLWSFRDAYDFAFRVYLASLKKFKN